MKVLITGSTGTLGPHVVRAFEEAGASCVGWNRAVVPPDDAAAVRSFLEQTRPDAVVHLAMGGEDWAAALASYAARHDVPFVFTSTAMVFHHEPDGPHGPHDERTARDEYGRYKIRCEDAILRVNANATVARIGWQIHGDARGNNMLAHLDSWQREQGQVEASRAWRPACSFMEDTASALRALVRSPRGGVVHLDSNAGSGWTFEEVARALARTFGRTWTVVPTEAYRHDQRLVGNEDLMPALSSRLVSLRAG